MNLKLLVPQPKILRKTGGELVLSEKCADQINRYLIGSEVPSCIMIENRTDQSGSVEDDSYQLEISENGIRINPAGPRGLFYAVQTLKQILRLGGGCSLECCSIEDRPDFPVRAVIYDISRDRVPTMATVKELVEMLSSWKYNQFQLYTEHTFAYSAHETVWKEASPFTAEEIRELDSFCAERGMELVPNQNSFGHMERWLKHDEYMHIAESPEGFTDPWDVFREHSSTLAPLVPETLDFLSGLYDELLPCFSSGMLNVGGDEPYELGKGRSRAACEKDGLDRVYLDFLKELHALGSARGKRIQIYGDIIMKYPHLISELPKDLVLVNWGYEANHPFREECEKIAASGIPFYVCTGVSSWNSVAGRWSNTKENILSGAANALRFGAEGFVVSEWGDNGHWQQLQAGLPGFLLGAAAAWNLEAAAGFSPEASCAAFIFNGDLNLAKAAMKLQDIWEASGVALHNVSLPAVLLLDPVYPYYREEYGRFRGYRFEKELKLISEACALLEAVPESLFKRETVFAAKLLELGCRLGRLQLSTPDLLAVQIPAEERTNLAADLENMEKEYRSLWHERSRPGGLDDSAARFRALIGVLEN